VLRGGFVILFYFFSFLFKKTEKKNLSRYDFLPLIKLFNNDKEYSLVIPSNNLKWNKIKRVITVLPRYTRTSTSFHMFDNFHEKTILYFSVGLMGFRKRKLKHLPGVVYRFYGFFFSFFRYYKKKIHLKYKRLYLKKIRRKVISLKNIMRKKSFFYNTFNSFKFFCKLLDIRKKFNMYKFKGVFKSREFFLGLRSKIVNVIKPIPLRKKRVRRKRLVFNGFLILSFLLFYDFEFRRLKLKKIAKLCRIMKSIFYPKRIKKGGIRRL